jgi:hypothetical protein
MPNMIPISRGTNAGDCCSTSSSSIRQDYRQIVQRLDGK